jgi:hypothetical protein
MNHEDLVATGEGTAEGTVAGTVEGTLEPTIESRRSLYDSEGVHSPEKIKGLTKGIKAFFGFKEKPETIKIRKMRKFGSEHTSIFQSKTGADRHYSISQKKLEEAVGPKNLKKTGTTKKSIMGKFVTSGARVP